MEHLCVVDQYRTYEREHVCQACRHRLDALLTEIGDLAAMLPDQLEPGVSGEPRVSGTREAPLPLRADVLDLTLPANQGSRGPMVRGALGLDPDQVGDLSVATELDTWARDWLNTGAPGRLPVPTVPSLIGWLRIRLEWACDEHERVGEFAEDVGDMVRRLRRAVGQVGDRKRVGRCPVTDDEGRSCGATLTADPWIDIIECPRCSTRWDRAQWGYLGSIIRTAEAA
jgi:hypothetical protein